MAQRVMIAMAIACNPRLLIADEPTTALDVTVQAQMLALLTTLQRERGMALMLITHDLAVVAEIAQRVVVMYAGQLVETGPVPQIFEAPRHPYTQALLAALPEHNIGRARLQAIPGVVPGQHDRPAGCLLSPRCPYAVARCRIERPPLSGSAAAWSAVTSRSMPTGSRRTGGAPKCAEACRDESAGPPGRLAARRTARAPTAAAAAGGARADAPLRGVARAVRSRRGWCARSRTCRSRSRRRTLAVVGESGCGKSHARAPGHDDRAADLRRAAARRRRRREGRRGATRKRLRPQVQMVFQNPYASLNPRKKIGTRSRSRSRSTPTLDAAARARARPSA